MRSIIALGLPIVAISQDERDFFVVLGARIPLRKGSQITQMKVAQALRVWQPTVNAYELAQRRVPASALPLLVRTPG